MGIIRLLGLGLLVFVFLPVAAAVVAFVYLPWWQALPASLVAMWLLVRAGSMALKPYARRMRGKVMKDVEHALRERGRPLRGAGLEVHSLTRVDPPPQLQNPPEFDGHESAEDEDLVEDRYTSCGPLACYQIEITITPVGGYGPVEIWDPSFLRVIADRSRIPGFPAGFPLEQIKTAEEGQGDNDSLKTCYGPRRLRVLVRVPAEALDLEMFYFLELIGHISLSASQ